MKRDAKSNRAGALLVCVLVCMGIALSISLTAVHSSLRERRQLAHELQMEQTRWLADAGLRLGIARARNLDGQEASWDFQPTISDRYTAKLVVTAKVIDDATGQLRLTATSTLTTNDPQRFETRHTAYFPTIPLEPLK